MGLFSRLKRKPKNPNSREYRWEMARMVVGQHIKYVTERINNEDSVIGRQGSLCIRNGEMIVFASADILFRTPVDELIASELMSLDGVILTGPDLEHGGEVRTVIAYYLYYR